MLLKHADTFRTRPGDFASLLPEHSGIGREDLDAFENLHPQARRSRRAATMHMCIESSGRLNNRSSSCRAAARVEKFTPSHAGFIGNGPTRATRTAVIERHFQIQMISPTSRNKAEVFKFFIITTRHPTPHQSLKLKVSTALSKDQQRLSYPAFRNHVGRPVIPRTGRLSLWTPNRVHLHDPEGDGP